MLIEMVDTAEGWALYVNRKHRLCCAGDGGWGRVIWELKPEDVLALVQSLEIAMKEERAKTSHAVDV